jgi:aldehyde:ferredoxin oxidoreductase
MAYLNENKLETQTLDKKLYDEFFGGYGLAVKMLYEKIPPGADPLGPENIIAFTTGTLVGTPAITGNRFTVSAKSPLTGTWGDANCGGAFGPSLKFAGYDGVFVFGCSVNPKYIYIENGEAELVDAKDIWGLDTTETENYLKKKHGDDVQVACIGPAGEKLSLIAAVIHDKGRAAGRSGLGAVMGSKKLKAIVVKGKLEVPLANPEKVNELRKKWVTDLVSKPSTKKFTKYGTIDHVASSTYSNDAPVKNWSGVGLRDFPTADKISDDNLLKFEYKKYACWRCPLACGGYFKVEKGPFKVEETHKPEYETCGVFGPNLLNDNPESLILINDICNRAGVDTISTGTTVGFAIECFEKGLLTLKDTDGLRLEWGNAEVIVELTKKICFREGNIGNLLGDGVKAASSRIKGSEEFAVHVNGQELPAHDPKYGPGWGTYYMVDATPGRHTQGSQNSYENGNGIPGLELPKLEKYVYTGKGEVGARTHNLFHAFHSLGLCRFALFRMNVNIWVEFLNEVTGENYTLEQLEYLGARIGVLRQMFNIREGLKVSEFKFPGRAYGYPPLEEGPLKNISVDIKTQMKEFYEAQKWDPQTGKPTVERLKELQLEELIKDL